jgi:hypothetical protein
MPIKHVEITAIDAKRFTKRGERVGTIRIENNSTVTLVSELNEREANVDFRYTANYGSAGIIKIEGTLIYEGDATELARQWVSSGNMPNEAANEIHTAIMRVCMPEAILVSRDLRLPPPLPLPKIDLQRMGGKKTIAGSAGVEVA